MNTLSQKKFLAPNMYFTDRKAYIRPFFYRGRYFCNRNIYNVDTWQARVFGAYKSSVKISYQDVYFTDQNEIFLRASL